MTGKSRRGPKWRGDRRHGPASPSALKLGRYQTAAGRSDCAAKLKLLGNRNTAPPITISAHMAQITNIRMMRHRSAFIAMAPLKSARCRPRSAGSRNPRYRASASHTALLASSRLSKALSQKLVFAAGRGEPVLARHCESQDRRSKLCPQQIATQTDRGRSLPGRVTVFACRATGALLRLTVF